MDVHKKFTDGGEIVYAPRLDSMKFYAGHNRVFFKFRTLNATNLKAVELYWDDEQLIVPVTMSSGYDSMLIEVPCKEEKSYTFKIRTTDEFGNHSLWETGFANSYGEMFIQSLVNRSIKSFSVSDNNGAITWYPPTSNLVRSEVRYTNTAQQETVISVPSAQMTTQCVGQTSNRFDVRSFFLPEADALDTFAVTWESVRPLYQVPRSKWSIKYCNSWHGMPSLTGTANMPHFIIDGDFTSFWHSSYANYAVGTHPLDPTITRDPPPFTIIIDFGEDIAIEQVDLYRRLNNNNTQLVIAYVPNIDPLLLTEADFKWLGPVSVSFSNHSIFKNYFYSGVANSNWQEVGRVEYPSDSNFDTPEKNQRIINPPTPVVARYLKLILPNTRSNGNVSLAEVFVSGR
jgi:hypothetical protein